MDPETPPDIQDEEDADLSDLHRSLGLSEEESATMKAMHAAKVRRRAEDAEAEARADRACDGCDHYRPNPPTPWASERSPRHLRRGECRHARPSRADGAGHRFPMVYAHEWCGDWRPDLRGGLESETESTLLGLPSVASGVARKYPPQPRPAPRGLVWHTTAVHLGTVTRRSDGRRLMVSIAWELFEQEYAAIAIEAEDGADEADVLARHAHKALGRFSTEAEAKATAEVFAAEWLRGVALAVCGCGEIER